MNGRWLRLVRLNVLACSAAHLSSIHELSYAIPETILFCGVAESLRKIYWDGRKLYEDFFVSMINEATKVLESCCILIVRNRVSLTPWPFRAETFR